MSSPADSSNQNLLPVQAYFNTEGDFQTFIGQGKPFYATPNPYQDNVTIVNSTIDNTTIGLTEPAAGAFTNIAVTTGTIATTAVGATDIANKQYVDAYVAGISWKPPVVYGTTGNITLSGLTTQAGGDWASSLTAGTRILVKDQSTASQNGIYAAASGAWTRTEDANTWQELVSALVFIETGSSLAGSAWYCTAQEGGTIGVTSNSWSNFSVAGSYSAGTGLALNGYVFSIANTTVTAASYGSASSVPVITVNAQGQLTAASNTSIAINGNQITSGTIDTGRLTGNYANITGVGTITSGVWHGSTIDNNYLTNSNVTINGTTVVLGAAGTVTANTTNALTFNSSGGDAAGTTFNGSAAKTVDYSTVGAPSATGTGASGTWAISVTGGAGSASLATSLVGGAAGSIPYQSSANVTSMLAAGSNGQVLSTTGSGVQWIGPSPFLDNITSTQGSILYRNSAGWTSLGPGTAGYLLQTGGAAANPSWLAQSSVAAGSASTATSATTATNLAGGSGGYIPYQSGAGATSFLTAGTSGQVLTSGGTGAPTWANATAYATVTDDTTTNADRYPLFASVTTGNLTTEYTSSTKLKYNPSTGNLSATLINSTSDVVAANGLWAKTSLTSTYTDGLVADYVTGTGRISVGGSDNVAIYNGGVANVLTVFVNTSGNVGIGTSNVAAKLSVVGTGYSPNITLADAATIAWDTSLGQVATFTFVSSSRTMGAPTNLVNGGFYALAVIQNSGSNTLSWNSVFKWVNGTAPTLSTAAGAKDFFVFRSDGTYLYQQGIAQAVA